MDRAKLKSGTRVGLIPIDWDSVRLDQVAKINESNLPENTDPMYRFKYLDLASARASEITLGHKEIMFKESPLRARRIVRKGDVLMSTVRPNLQGHLAIDFDAYDLICSTGFAVITPNSIDDTEFIHQSLYSNAVTRQLNGMIAGSNYPAINASDVEGLHVAYPSSRIERLQIGKVLATWDRAIEHANDLVTKKNTLKAGLMQRLFPRPRNVEPRMGAPLTPLSTFLSPELRAIPKPEGSYKGLGIRSHGKGTFIREVQDPGEVMMDTLYLVRTGDLIVNITFAWEGAIAIAKDSDEGALVSHRFPTFRIDSSIVLPDYLRQVILTKTFVHQLGLVSPGGAGRNRVLNKSAFLRIQIPIPSLQTQAKVAALLGACDREVSLLKDLLSALRRQKSGLAQKLLTGRMRTKYATTATEARPEQSE